MLKHVASFLLIGLIAAGCTPHKQQSAPLPAKTSLGIQTSQYRPVTAFNGVDVQGQINLRLHTGYKKPQVVLKGDARDLLQVKTQVNQNTLYIVLGKGFPRYGQVQADVKGLTLNRVRYVGSGSISGNRLRSDSLDLFLVNSGPTQLAGMIRLKQLEVSGGGLVQISGLASPYLKVIVKGNNKVQLTGVAKASSIFVDGDGSLSLYWVKSDSLSVRAKKRANIQLAGVVNRLNVELWGNARFKGRYLRANRSFVKTHEHAIAEISSVKHQSSLATDASDIYYYNLPNTRADFMAFNGAVLDMREWNQPELKDFTPYNKQFP